MIEGKFLKYIPENFHVSDNAIDIVHQCLSEFIGFVTSEWVILGKRDMLKGQDLI